MKNFFLLIKMIFAALFGWSWDYNINLINPEKATPALVSKLKQFESSFSYPFSDTEQFKIEHGKNGDYFAFFKRLGHPYYFIATHRKNKTVTKTVNGQQVTVEHRKGEIAAVACAVLRTMKKYNGSTTRAWYICDLKVNENYQGEHLPLMIAQQVGVRRFLQCPRGFGICMNPPQGEPKAAKIFKKHSQFKGTDTKILNLYTLTAEQVRNLRSTIAATMTRNGYLQRGKYLGCISTNGVKDYQIFDLNKGTSRPWNLLHLQPIDAKEENYRNVAQQEGAMHMISAVDGTALDKDFRQLFGAPSSTAQIVSYGMKDVDFNLITSSQI